MQTNGWIEILRNEMELSKSQPRFHVNRRISDTHCFLGRHSLLQGQLLEIVNRSCQHRFAVVHHDWSLDEFRMRGHHLQQFSIAQALVRDVLFVGGLFRTHDIVRPQTHLA